MLAQIAEGKQRGPGGVFDRAALEQRAVAAAYFLAETLGGNAFVACFAYIARRERTTYRHRYQATHTLSAFGIFISGAT